MSRILIICIATIFVLLSGCSKKKEKPASKPPRVEPIEMASEVVMPDDTTYEEEEAEIAPVETSSSVYFVIQLAACENRSYAESVVDKLNKQGIEAFIEQAYVSSKQRDFYRVRVGTFSKFGNAKAEAEKITRKTGYSYWIAPVK